MPTRPAIADNILECIGYTPLVRLHRLVAPGDAEVLVKLESFNPLWSVKDRIGYAMLKKAQDDGLIKPGVHTIVEPTSGNTGIALAMAAAVMGYPLILTMPDSMTVERRKVLAALGAEVRLTPAAKGMKGAIALAEELLKEIPNSYMPQQFNNPANPEIHRKTTAVEIMDDLKRAENGKLRLDGFVAGVGTGGTVTGAGEALREKLPELQIFVVEPVDSPVLSGGQPGPHKIQGIGAGFVPQVLNTKIYTEVVKVATPDAVSTARRLAKEEGIFVGISSGAICWAALQTAKKLGKGKRVIAVLPDLGERYLSTDLFAAPE